jgi:GNAT superfamily N-acetyltransferase
MRAMSTTFRAATAADAPSVAEVYLASRKRFLPFAPLAHSDDDVRGWVTDMLIPSGRVTVAVDGERIVGLMALSRADGFGWVDQLYLDPASVAHGIGTALLERAKRELGRPIRLHTFQANAGARRFYERHGFRALEFGDGSGNEENCPDVLYEWR